LAYREHYIDVWRGEQFTPTFGALNPLGKVPVIIDHDGSEGGPLRLAESGAILLYLAEKSRAFLPASGVARARCLEWLTFAVGTLGPMFGQYNHFRQFADDQHYSLSRYRTEVRRIYRALNAQLATMPYLGGGYSVADIAAYAWLFAMERQYVSDCDWVALVNTPILADWLDRIAERPAVARAQTRFLALPSTLSLADAEQRDRVFGRGNYASPTNFCHEDAPQ